MINNIIVILIIVNITSCSPIFRNSDTKFDYSNVTHRPSPNLFYFRQRLNHFNSDCGGWWLQKYAVTVEYFKKSGPAFLVVNGAESMDNVGEFPYNVLAYAKYLNAIVFSLEHRFYGKTLPTNGSIMQHLSSAQALADIAHFIKGMSKQFRLPKHTKFILFGCSYGGRLASWARLKYPHLIYGAVASSAPILSKVDYYEYDQIVEESLKSYDSKCVDSIMTGFDEIANTDDTPQNRKKILKMFDIDDDIIGDTMILIQSFALHTMLNLMRRTVQHNDISFISIHVFCAIMTEHNGTKLEALSILSKMDKEIRGVNYTSMPFEQIQYIQNSAEDYERSKAKAWNYQLCTEFGYFTSWNATFVTHVRHLLRSIELEIQYTCARFFGLYNYTVGNVTEKINHMNSQYGGLDFNIHRVIFIHGSIDPWYKAGLYMKSNSSLYETIFIRGTSHCTDIASPTDYDIPELRYARNEVMNTLHNWLNTKSNQTSYKNKD